MKKILPILLLLATAIVGCHTKHEQKAEEATETTKKDTALKAPPDAKVSEPIVEKTDIPKTKVAINKPSLTIIVDNLHSPTAPVVMGVYGTKNKFLDTKDQLKEYHFKPKNGKLVAKITDIPYGIYGMAIYQDVNSNGKIDKNLIGIPTEPYAFSNNYKPNIKAPSFNDCKFEFNAKSNTITIALLK